LWKFALVSSDLFGSSLRSTGRQVLIYFLVSSTVFLFIYTLRQAGLLQATETSAYDLTQAAAAHLFPEDEGDGEPGVTLVMMSDADEMRFGAILPDLILTEVLDKVVAAGARVVGVDMYRDQPVLDKQGGDGRPGMNRLLRAHDNIVMIQLFHAIGPPPVLADTDRIGFSDFIYDEGGIIRRGLLFLSDEQRSYSSLSLVLALHYLAPLGIWPTADPVNPQNLRLGRVTLPPLTPDFGGYVGEDTGGYQFMLRFLRDTRGFRELDLGQVVDSRFSRDDFAGRLVIIGKRSASAKDFFFTSVSRWQSGEQRVYGAKVHAIAASQLIRIALGRSPPLGDLSTLQEYLWILCWILVGALVGLSGRSVLLLALLTTAAMGILFFICVWTLANGWWIPLAPSWLGFSATAIGLPLVASVRERRERREIMHLFSRRVSPAVAELYWRQRHSLLSAGGLPPQQLTATILFADIRDFTQISEGVEPGQLMEWLNAFMERMVDAVFAHQGHLDKIIGDAIMAVFGVPFPSVTPEAIGADARRAVGCAVAMAAELPSFNAIWGPRGFPPVSLRIGLNTGSVVAGTLGSAQRQEYTVLGDAVNTASRLESFDKSLDQDAPCRILLSEATARHLLGTHSSQRVGEVALKGKQRVILVHRLEL